MNPQNFPSKTLQFKGLQELWLFARVCVITDREKLYLENKAITLSEWAKRVEEQDKANNIKVYTRRFLLKLVSAYILIPSVDSTKDRPIYFLNAEAVDVLFEDDPLLSLLEENFINRARIYLP